MKSISRKSQFNRAQKMGPKKKNHNPNKKQEIIQNPKAWPNLPQNLLNLITTQPHLFHTITSFGCIVKSWRSPSTKCSRHPRLPQLVETNGGGGGHRHKLAVEFRDLNGLEYWPRMRKEYRPSDLAPPGVYFKGHSHGTLVVMAANKRDCYLWHPSNYWGTATLAPWNYPNISFKLCAPSGSRCSSQLMVVTGSSSPAFAVNVSRWTEGKGYVQDWSFGDCNMTEPYDPSTKMRLSNAIGLKEGKFYALSLQGSVIAIERQGEVDSSRFVITAVGGNRAVPRKASKLFREYLLESDGEILLVFLLSRDSIEVVDEVEVYRLDAGGEVMLWVEMDGIGEKALFLEDECCMGVNAMEVGCRKNSVYFTHFGLKNWLVFDMKTAQISAAEDNLCDLG